MSADQASLNATKATENEGEGEESETALDQMALRHVEQPVHPLFHCLTSHHLGYL